MPHKGTGTAVVSPSPRRRVSAVGGYSGAWFLNTVLKIGEQAESACSFQICGSRAATSLDRFAAGWYNKCNIVCVFYIRAVDF